MKHLQTTTQPNYDKPEITHTVGTEEPGPDSDNTPKSSANTNNEHGQIWHCSEYDF